MKNKTELSNRKNNIDSNNRKAKLLSVSKDEYRCIFSFKKNWVSILIVDKILYRLGIDLDPYRDGLKPHFYDHETGKRIGLSKCIDEIYDFRNKDYAIDIFMGKKKIIFVINSFKDRQDVISKVIFSCADFEGDENEN
jgi:hypothetical protein